MIKGDGAQRGIVGRSWKTMEVIAEGASQRSQNRRTRHPESAERADSNSGQQLLVASPAVADP